MTKEKFVEYMNELEELNKIEDEITQSFKKLDKDFNFISFSKFEILIVKLLEEAMEDKPREWDSWISWWIYETDFGKKKEIAYSAEKTGVSFKLKNAGDLYDFIKMK